MYDLYINTMIYHMIYESFIYKSCYTTEFRDKRHPMTDTLVKCITFIIIEVSFINGYPFGMKRNCVIKLDMSSLTNLA